MKKTVSNYEFYNWFDKNRPDNFSRVGLTELFNYIEQYEEDCGTEIEFDPIALCVEYTEYDNIAELHLIYDSEDYPDMDSLYDYTTVIPVGLEGFIIADF